MKLSHALSSFQHAHGLAKRIERRKILGTWIKISALAGLIVFPVQHAMSSTAISGGSIGAATNRWGDRLPATDINTATYTAQLPTCLDNAIHQGLSAHSEQSEITAITDADNPATLVMSLGANCRATPAGTASCSQATDTEFTNTFTLDSSANSGTLVCTSGPCAGVSIPVSRIRWTSDDTNAVPNGTFDGTANQLLVEVTDDTRHSPLTSTNKPRGFLHNAALTYFYDNSLLLPAGTYETTLYLNSTGAAGP